MLTSSSFAQYGYRSEDAEHRRSYREPQKWNARNQVIAAHILCAENNEDEVNAQFGNTYCKERKESRAAREIPEGRAMKYVPYVSTGVIKRSPKRFRQLQKN